MNVLVLSDNPSILERAKPIFEKRKVNRWTFTNSDDINPKKDYYHIQKYYDLVFSLHCKKIFPKVLTDSVRCINIHPGIYRGMYTHVHDIAGGTDSGCSIMEMTEQIDGGPMIECRILKVLPTDTSSSLYKRIIDAEMQMLDECLDGILADEYNAPMALSDTFYYSMEDFNDLCNFNPMETATFQQFFNRMRALSHDGYFNAHMNGIKFKLIIDGN